MDLCFYLSEQMCVFSGGQELSPLVRKQRSQALGGWVGMFIGALPAPHLRHSSCLQLCSTVFLPGFCFSQLSQQML